MASLQDDAEFRSPSLSFPASFLSKTPAHSISILVLLYSDAVLGHPFDPTSRPILRFLLQHLSNFFFYASILLSGHYWFTRSYTTEISISACAIDTLVRVVLFFITLVGFRKGDLQDYGMVAVVLFAASLVWSLAAKLKWRWEIGYL